MQYCMGEISVDLFRKEIDVCRIGPYICVQVCRRRIFALGSNHPCNYLMTDRKGVKSHYRYDSMHRAIDQRDN